VTPRPRPPPLAPDRAALGFTLLDTLGKSVPPEVGRSQLREKRDDGSVLGTPG